MVRTYQVILTVDVIDIDVIVVIIPVGRPGLGVLEIIAAVIKAAILAAPHVEMMFAPKTAAELFVRNTPAATALIRVSAVVVLFGSSGTLVVLRTIFLLRRSRLLISIALILLFGAIPFPIAIVLSRSIIFLLPAILLRSLVFLGAVLLRSIVLPRLIVLSCSIILTSSIVLLARPIILLGAISILLLTVGLLSGFFLVLLSPVGLLSLSWLFLPFRFLLRLIFIGLLSRVAGCADKENHHRGTKDEFHFDSSRFLFRKLSLSGLRSR
jgi:hypothetical protein